MNDVIDLPAASTTRPGAPRVDLYAPIHKGLRHFMTDTLLRVGSVDTADEIDLQGTLAQLDALLTHLRSHLQHENDVVHPAIEARQPGVAQRIAGEHDDHLASIEALQAERAELARTPAALRAPLALRLYRHLALFVAENLQHMHVEETVHNQALWAAYSDAELIALHDTIMEHVGPQEMATGLLWMAPALSHAELAGMLGGLRATQPAGQVHAVLELVKARLSPARWNKLADALGLASAPGSGATAVR